MLIGHRQRLSIVKKYLIVVGANRGASKRGRVRGENPVKLTTGFSMLRSHNFSDIYIGKFLSVAIGKFLTVCIGKNSAIDIGKFLAIDIGKFLGNCIGKF